MICSSLFARSPVLHRFAGHHIFRYKLDLRTTGHFQIAAACNRQRLLSITGYRQQTNTVTLIIATMGGGKKHKAKDDEDDEDKNEDEEEECLEAMELCPVYAIGDDGEE